MYETELEALLEDLCERSYPVPGRRIPEEIAGLMGSLYVFHASDRQCSAFTDSSVDMTDPRGQDTVESSKPDTVHLGQKSHYRHLLHDRQYNRLDFDDFLDYATSSLTRPVSLPAFLHERIEFYEGFEQNVQEPMVEIPGTGQGCAIIDCAIARQRRFVSAAARMRLFAVDSVRDMLFVMTFAPIGEPSLSPLAEWDRFCTSRIGPVALDDNGASDEPNIEELNGADNYAMQRLAFLVCQLTLYIPAYFEFMYDLVVTEQLPARESQPKPRTELPQVQPCQGPKFRLIRSIRVIRINTGLASGQRQWSPPSHTVWVTAHWRHLKEEFTGKDRSGIPVDGWTWVHEHTRYNSRDFDGEESPDVAPAVTINIKQTLSHAMDVIEAHRRVGDVVAADPPGALRSEKPSPEWMATERAKLSAGLRYAIFKRDGFRCRVCGVDAAQVNDVRLEVDHVVPIAKWGRTVPENLRTLCHRCNRGKQDRQ